MHHGVDSLLLVSFQSLKAATATLQRADVCIPPAGAPEKNYTAKDVRWSVDPICAFHHQVTIRVCCVSVCVCVCVYVCVRVCERLWQHRLLSSKIK